MRSCQGMDYKTNNRVQILKSIKRPGRICTVSGEVSRVFGGMSPGNAPPLSVSSFDPIGVLSSIREQCEAASWQMSDTGATSNLNFEIQF